MYSCPLKAISGASLCILVVVNFLSRVVFLFLLFQLQQVSIVRTCASVQTFVPVAGKDRGYRIVGAFVKS